ncbi:hypothetical protein JTE90_011217 [Oedothorax gibbosus]|uniref:Uncharacterized protein n=1 Tax=Oedothorax gibbosus TaxID=931172 RepID=A0AAV6W0F1_9ARAC|nr:hypothetical protein JTE90_011217 [Oedothorax gibbosus]
MDDGQKQVLQMNGVQGGRVWLCGSPRSDGRAERRFFLWIDPRPQYHRGYTHNINLPKMSPIFCTPDRKVCRTARYWPDPQLTAKSIDKLAPDLSSWHLGSLDRARLRILRAEIFVSR